MFCSKHYLDSVNPRFIMSSSDAQRPGRGGLALYANLLDPASASAAASSTITRGPVVFNPSEKEGVQQDEASHEQQQQMSAGRYFAHVPFTMTWICL